MKNTEQVISVVLGTAEPEILVHEWPAHEVIWGVETFTLLHDLWCRSKEYYPCIKHVKT